jgi:hypothetical protein
MTDERMEHWWNDYGKEKLKCSEKNQPHCYFFTTNPTWAALELNSGPCVEKLVANHMMYGMVL